MRKGNLLRLFLIVFFISATVMLGENEGRAGFLDSVKKAAEDAVTDQLNKAGLKSEDASKSTPASQESDQQQPAEKPKAESKAKPSSVTKGTPHPSGNPPDLMFSTVLNGVKLDYKTGKLYLDKIQAVFLPTPSVKSSSIYPYDPVNGGGLVWAELMDEANKQVAKFEFTGELLSDPYWLLSTARCGACEPGNRTNPLPPGKYVLNFFVEGDHFYQFPFTVDILKPKNAFSGGNLYFINGDWEKWGYLYYPEADPEKNLTWKVWLRNKEPNKKGIDGKVDVTLLRSGTPIAKSRPATYNLKPWWIRFEFGLTDPMQGTSGGRYFKAKDLLAKDGSYTIEMVINGKPYGKWNFSVDDGNLAYRGRTLRGEADPLTFVEGGLDAWWYEK